MKAALLTSLVLGSALAAQGEQPKSETPAPRTVRILLIGDRSLDSHLNKVGAKLKDLGETVRSPLGHLSSGAAVERIDEILGEKKWDVVAFNFGLSDLMCRDPRTKQIRVLSPKAGGVPVTPLARFDDHLKSFIEAVQKSGARPLYLTTPALDPRHRNTAIDGSLIATYNDVARNTMRKQSVAVLDVWSSLEKQVTARIEGKKGRPNQLRDRAHIDLLKTDLSQPIADRIRSVVSRTTEPRNVLLIAVDDLNDWVGCLGGHPQANTPHIDALAQRGTLFANAHCQAPVCNPSRASLLTGRYPHDTGIYFLSPSYAEAPALKGVPTLPERFAQAGYDVAGVGKVFHNRGNRTFSALGAYGGSMGGFGPRPEKKISQPHGHALWDWGAFPERDQQMPDHKVADWAIERLRSGGEEPFFLAVGFWRPHVPMYAPKAWFDLHPRNQIALPRTLDDDCEDLSSYARDLTSLEHVAPTHAWIQEAGQWDHAVQAYLASTSFVDHQVGRVLEALEESGHRDDTVVVLFADHGFHLGEKQRWAKRSLWEDGTRVPLIVVDPDRNGGQISTKPAELIDIFPTLLALTGLPEDPEQRGQSLVPLLEDPADAGWKHPAITSFGPGNHAVRTERYRYIHYNDGSEELYDHEADPHEWRNLVRRGQAVRSELEAVLAAHRDLRPRDERALLPGKSTGHAAYTAAERNRKDK